MLFLPSRGSPGPQGRGVQVRVHPRPSEACLLAAPVFLSLACLPDPGVGTPTVKPARWPFGCCGECPELLRPGPAPRPKPVPAATCFLVFPRGHPCSPLSALRFCGPVTAVCVLGWVASPPRGALGSVLSCSVFQKQDSMVASSCGGHCQPPMMASVQLEGASGQLTVLLYPGRAVAVTRCEGLGEERAPCPGPASSVTS